MRYKKSIRLTYNIKNEEGFVVERRIKFVTLDDMAVFVKLIKHNKNLVGIPVMETK